MFTEKDGIRARFNNLSLNFGELRPEDKTKSIKLYVTALDNNGLESEPSEEIGSSPFNKYYITAKKYF